MIRFIKKHGADLLFLLFITLLLMYPYIAEDLLPVEHDTFFHVSRIEQLAISIKEGNFLPALYPYENNGYGYASPLFYSDLLLIPSALLHIAGISVSVCYKITIGTASFFSALSMFFLMFKITGKRSAGWIASSAYLFSNYHITDIYVRGAMGEVFALIFLPVILNGLYSILEMHDTKAWTVLCTGLCGLALSHNLTFLMGSVLTALIFFIRLHKIDKDVFKAVFKGVFFAFLLTAFYTIPMIEQLQSQEFIVDYYASHSTLEYYSMDFWQYFANRTVFGLAGNYLEHDSTMLENAGYFLTFAPLLWIFVKRETKNRYPFVTMSLILGYICLLLPSSLLPWEKMSFFRIMQFPWRFNTLTIVLLSLPASFAFTELFRRRSFSAVLISVILCEGLWHVMPVTERTFGITSGMTWEEVKNGALCNPYYSATYVRVELAGGDYLPLDSVDFRERSAALRTVDDQELDISYTKEGSTLTFETGEQYPSEIMLPLTYYKGYKAYRLSNGEKEEVACRESSSGLVIVECSDQGTYICTYENTLLRKACIALSGCTFVLLILFGRIKKKVPVHQ